MNGAVIVAVAYGLTCGLGEWAIVVHDVLPRPGALIQSAIASVGVICGALGLLLAAGFAVATVVVGRGNRLAGTVMTGAMFLCGMFWLTLAASAWGGS